MSIADHGETPAEPADPAAPPSVQVTGSTGSPRDPAEGESLFLAAESSIELAGSIPVATPDAVIPSTAEATSTLPSEDQLVSQQRDALQQQSPTLPPIAANEMAETPIATELQLPVGLERPRAEAVAVSFSSSAEVSLPQSEMTSSVAPLPSNGDAAKVDGSTGIEDEHRHASPTSSWLDEEEHAVASPASPAAPRLPSSLRQVSVAEQAVPRPEPPLRTWEGKLKAIKDPLPTASVRFTRPEDTALHPQPVVRSHIGAKKRASWQRPPSIPVQGVKPSTKVSMNLLQLLRTWDKSSRGTRELVLQSFIEYNSGKTGPELEQEFGNGGSLFLTRLHAWLRLTYLLGHSLSLQLQALSIFVSASSGHRFLAEFMEVGGILTVLEILGLVQASEVITWVETPGLTSMIGR